MSPARTQGFAPGLVLAGLALGALALAGCGTGSRSTETSADTMTAASIRVASIGAASSGAASTSSSRRSGRPISFETLRGILAEEVRRVEIELVPGGPVADEIEAEEEDLDDDEEIESRIVEIVRDPVTSAVIGFRLRLGGLVVGFTEETEFEDERGEADEELTLEEFVARVQAALDRGEHPPVEVEREPLRGPDGTIVAQDPDDATFIAAKIELEDEAGRPEIEINVDADNVSDAALQTCTPPVNRGIKVLGLCIRIVPGTEIEVD